MKIAFLWNFNKAKEILPNYRDGLRAALEIIAKEHQVDWYLGEECNKIPDGYNFLLFWTDSNDPIVDNYVDYPAKKGLCLTTDGYNIEHLKSYDVIFCESTIILENIRKNGLKCLLAFGTDTNFFTPDDTEKDIEYFYPATFSPWKNHQEIAYLGNQLTCVGTIQPDGMTQYDACLRNNVNVKVGYFPAKEIRDLYRRVKKVIIPAIHGSERTTLEAMSMNIPIEITLSTNEKVLLLRQEYLVSGEKTSRDFILKNYSSEVYARIY